MVETLSNDIEIKNIRYGCCIEKIILKFGKNHKQNKIGNEQFIQKSSMR